MHGFAECGVCGLSSVQQGLVSKYLIKDPHTLFLCSVEVRWKISQRCFILSSELGQHFTLSLCLSSSVAYLAVKTDDLCRVFTLRFICYSDKATGFVCTSVQFMSVY